MRGRGQNGKQDSLLLSCICTYSILNTYDFIILLVLIKLSEAVRYAGPFA